MITLTWGVSPFFGWGVYGLNLALELTERSLESRTLAEVNLHGVGPLRTRRLESFVQRSAPPLTPVCGTVLRALGNDMSCGKASDDIAGHHIGVAFFENPLSLVGIERTKRYNLIVTGSSWNEQLLRGEGLTNVRTVRQGVDRSLFYPSPKRGFYKDRFVIFSGGKAEPRKGQDLVVKAFRIFAARHPEALLVTAWQSPWPQLARGMDLNLSSVSKQVIDVGLLPNSEMAAVYRECDVALFPNRAEGGTNLVAMECLACGVPTLLSANTGHLDLIARSNKILPLIEQRPNSFWSEWRDTDIDEILTSLEVVRDGTWSVPDQHQQTFADLTWSNTTEQLLREIHSVGAQRAETRLEQP